MRIVFIFFTAALICSCKPKDKNNTLESLLKKDSVSNREPEKKDLSTKEFLLRKWKMQDVSPAPQSPEEKQEMLNTVIEFTSDGKVMVTGKNGTKEEATFTLSMDNKYILSVEAGKDKIDSILIEEVNANMLVLLQEKENMRIVLAPQK